MNYEKEIKLYAITSQRLMLKDVKLCIALLSKLEFTKLKDNGINSLSIKIDELFDSLESNMISEWKLIDSAFEYEYEFDPAIQGIQPQTYSLNIRSVKESSYIKLIELYDHYAIYLEAIALNEESRYDNGFDEERNRVFLTSHLKEIKNIFHHITTLSKQNNLTVV